jgi:hypothetical protein
VVEAVAVLALGLARRARATGGFAEAALCADLLTALHRRVPLATGATGAATRAAAVVELLDACRVDPAPLEPIAGAVCRQVSAAVSADPTASPAVERLLDDTAALAQWGGTVLEELPDVVRVLLSHGELPLARRLARTIWGFHDQRDEDVPFYVGALLTLSERRNAQARHGAHDLSELFEELCSVDLAGAAHIFCDIAETEDAAGNPNPAAEGAAWPLVAGSATGELSRGHSFGSLDAFGWARSTARALGSALAGLAPTGPDAHPVVALLVERLRSPSAWADLLKPGEDPVGLGRALLPAMASGSLLAHPDTHENAARLLSALADLPDLAAQLEAAVIAAGAAAAEHGMPDRLGDELIGCLPAAAISDPGLLARRDELAATGGPPPLTPRPQMISNWMPSDHAEVLKEHGLDDLPANTVAAFQSLRTEYTRASNARAERLLDGDRQLVGAFMTARAALGDATGRRFQPYMLLVQAAGVLAADAGVLPGTPPGDAVHRLLVEASRVENAGEFCGRAGWSPGVRDEAARGLARLLFRSAWRDGDVGPSLRAAVVELAADDNPVVRMQAAAGLPAVHADLTASERAGELGRRLERETDPRLLPILLRVLCDEAAEAPLVVDAILSNLAERLADGFLTTEPEGVVAGEVLLPLLAYLVAAPQTRFASQLVAGWFKDAVTHSEKVAHLAHDLREYVNAPSERTRLAAFDYFRMAADAARDQWLRRHADKTPSAVDPATIGAAAVARSIAQELYFASGAYSNLNRASRPEPPDITQFADLAVPILRTCAQVPHAQIIHPAVQTLIHLAPRSEKRMLLAVASAVPERGNYPTDSIAGKTVVPYLERLLAEHPRLALHDTDGLAAFRHLLQTFAAAGNIAALNLAYTFSDVFR